MADDLGPARTTSTAPRTRTTWTLFYGELFELDSEGVITSDLATGYSISTDAKTITLNIRPGVTFTDGTPFNVAAVVGNIDRDLKSACTCKPTWPVTSVTAAGTDTVVIKLSAPDGAFIDEIFDSTADWIASPTAVQKMGEKAFAVSPVRHGPFVVVSDTLSSALVLKRNPGYWQKGRPYLATLTFKSVASGRRGPARPRGGYVDMSTPSLLQQAAKSSSLEVENQLSTSPYDLQLNTLTAPFNNPKARQAIYAATNFAPILQHVFDNMYPSVQGFTGPGGICYDPSVTGYQGYDPTLAKTLVQQSGLGNVTINLGTIQNLVARRPPRRYRPSGPPSGSTPPSTPTPWPR